MSMIESIVGGSGDDGIAVAAQLLHVFNVEYDEPAPPPDDYAFLVTSEDDHRARRLYEAAGFRRTEGEGGPLMLAYEREL